MYPAQPTWQSGSPLSAWWQINRVDGGLNVCASQGASFVRFLQQSINAVVGRGVWNNPWQPTDLHTGAINVDGVWGSMTLQGLYKLAASHGASNAMLAPLLNDYQANTPGRAGNQFSNGTLLVAIWASQHPDLDISKVHLSSNAIAPRWDVPPPSDGGGSSITCWDVNAVPPTTSGTGGTGSGVGNKTPLGTEPSSNPISSPGLFGSTAGGTNTGLLFLAGAAVVTAGAVAIAASKPRTRYRRRRR